MNSKLLKPYTPEDITAATTHMAPLKSPGPDDLCSRPSFTCRSILSSKVIVRAGSRWRNGDGRTTRIQDGRGSSDPWIPRLSSFRPRNAIGPSPPCTTVCHLFGLASGDWNVPLLSYIFDHDDCMVILSLPLSRAPLCDEIVGQFTHSGSFSVKSAYHLAIVESRKHKPQSFSSDDRTLRNDWQGVWNYEVPNKIRVFAWQLGTDSLPLGANLVKRIPGIDVVCPLCQAPEESDRHTFLLCPFARMGVRSAGWSRNKRWTTNELSYPEQTIAFARNYLAASSGFLEHHHILSMTTTIVKWMDPPDDVVKINSDAAIFKEVGNFGIGIIARNSQGQSLAWSASRHHRSISPEAAETWAAHIAIQLAAQHGWTKIILECDCATSHIKLTTSGDRTSNISPVIHDILLASSSFVLCTFSLVQRTANVIAHSLSRHATGNEMGSNILPSHSCDLVLTNFPM
ncbi:UNVERIFIED_CONTAM: hypothetical protein Sradi_5919200 [Sesamum radiatum]|uniref:RNase H type-1 domain-containing protein n=1 Tax=Sesamum radiatum TaxID=300843 RepID=A0AAW2KSS9_SESRA